MMDIIRKVKVFSPKGIFYLLQSIVTIGINPYIIVYLGNKLYPQKSALCADNIHFTYQQLCWQTQQTATLLEQRYGLLKQQKIAIACTNHVQHILLIFAAAYLGLDIYLLNAEMSAIQLAKFQNKHRFSLFIDDTLANDLVATHIPIEQCVKARRSYFNKIVVLTSGSTGGHKAVTRKSSVTAFVSPFISLITQLKLVRYQSVYLATPIYHGFGIITLCVSFLLGAKVFMSRQFKVAKVCELIETHQIAVITLVPLMLQRMLYHNAHALRSLQCIVSGGAALAPQLVAQTINNLGDDKLYNLYGSSEAGFCIMATPTDLLYSAKTIGKPIAGVETKIINLNEETVTLGQVGQLCIKCKWSTQSANWIATGDMAYVDQKGYYFLLGRTDDMIVSGGENVYPAEVENALMRHPAIREALVISVHDIEFGARLKAFVVVDPKRGASKEMILTWLASEIARYQMPKELVLIDEIPLSSVGKPLIRN